MGIATKYTENWREDRLRSWVLRESKSKSWVSCVCCLYKGDCGGRRIKPIDERQWIQHYYLWQLLIQCLKLLKPWHPKCPRSR
jgi:hypothetical protein